MPNNNFFSDVFDIYKVLNIGQSRKSYNLLYIWIKSFLGTPE